MPSSDELERLNVDYTETTGAAGLVVLVEFVRIDARPDIERRTHGRPAPHPGG